VRAEVLATSAALGTLPGSGTVAPVEPETVPVGLVDARSDRRLLVRYRVLAFTTAALLIVLVFVGVPLQLAAGQAGVVNAVGTMHGFLYLVYLYFAFELTRRLGVPTWQMILVLLAGTVPFCAFIAERKMTRLYEQRTGEIDAPASSAAGADA
jgi:integral membrane protein